MAQYRYGTRPHSGPNALPRQQGLRNLAGVSRNVITCGCNTAVISALHALVAVAVAAGGPTFLGALAALCAFPSRRAVHVPVLVAAKQLSLRHTAQHSQVHSGSGPVSDTLVLVCLPGTLYRMSHSRTAFARGQPGTQRARRGQHPVWSSDPEAAEHRRYA